jgi:hypothetical protein
MELPGLVVAAALNVFPLPPFMTGLIVLGLSVWITEPPPAVVPSELLSVISGLPLQAITENETTTLNINNCFLILLRTVVN